MKIQIEDWANENLESRAVELMKEAVMCYKVGAYRAAYLLSYLAFKTTIRERVLDTSMPDGVTETYWNAHIISPLVDDNKWEERLNTIIAASKEDGKSEGAIFRFTNYERTKNRYEYWKNIRNSCAHAKDEHITSSTVEQFWNYMQDDLPLYYVMGSKVYLFDRLCYSYKYFISVGEDKLKHILNQIAAVYKKSTKQCFEKLYENNKSCISLCKNNIEFWKIIIDTENEVVREAYIDFLYQHIECFIEWYQEFPKIFKLMENRHKPFIQEFLVPFLEKGWYIEATTFWKLMVEILCVDVNLIDLDNITSKYQKFVMVEEIELLPEKLAVLQKYKVFKRFLFAAGKEYFWNDANSHWNYYSYNSDKRDEIAEKCFEFVEWDIDVVDKINLAYKELEESLEMRGNSDSKNNAEIRRKSYDKVIAMCDKKIIETINEAKKVIADYKCIETSLQRQGLI